MSLTEDARRRLIVATASTAVGNEIADSIDGLVITQPLTLYVETTGNDANPGTAISPFRTIQAAIDWLRPYEIAAGVTIQVGAGSFAGFMVGMFKYRLVPGVSVFVDIVGTEEVVYSGTITSSTLDQWRTGVDSTKTWIVNELRGMFVKSTSLGVLNLPVLENDATSFLVPTTSVPSGAYTITRPSTIITGPAFSGSGSAANASAVGIIHLADCDGSNQMIAAQTRIRMLKLSDSTATTFVQIRGRSYLSMQECVFQSSASAGTLIQASGAVIGSCSISQSAFLSGAGTVSGLGATGGAIKWTATQCLFNVSSTACLFDGPGHAVNNCYFAPSVTSAVQLQVGRVGQVVATTCRFLANTSGVGALFIEKTGSMLYSGELRFLSCTLALSCLGVMDWSISSGTITGTGNTTGISCAIGGKARITATSTITSTTDISVDGVTSTLVAMRALTPKAFPVSPNVYGSVVYE